MGAAIAALLADAGVPVDLLDIAPDTLTPDEQTHGLTLDSPVVRNRIVRAGLERARRARPAAFMGQAAQVLVRPGNLTDNFDWLHEADWIVEAIVERLEAKQQLIARLESVVKPTAIVSSNTSGIPIHKLAEGRQPDFRRRVLGTHFFNPPRYLKLLEVVPTAETDPAVVAAIRQIGEETLGKGVVVCKDTPNFIANRLGSINSAGTLAYILRHEYAVDEVDALAGPLIGRPKTAFFRLQDVVGLDIAVSVQRNLYDLIPDDPFREMLRVPAVVALQQQMLSRGWLGNKTGQGFYKEVREGGKRAFWVLGLKTLEYRAPQPPSYPSVADASKLPALADRLRFLVKQTDRAGQLIWVMVRQSLTYAAWCVGEIADDVASIDDAVRWGFGHELGPFETWDALGVAETAERIRAEGVTLPGWIDQMLESGHPSFYRTDDRGQTSAYDPRTGAYRSAPLDPQAIVLRDLKASGKEVRRNASASLIDLGDGVLCLEFHSKANSLDADVTEMVRQAKEEVERNWTALVVGNQGQHFCAGANLVFVAQSAQAGELDAIERLIHDTQDAFMGLRHCRRPVVSAPFDMALGGGAEVTMAGARVCAHAEAHIGQVEPNVGLVPGGGGCKELLRRVVSPAMRVPGTDPLPILQQVLLTIAGSRVSGSAAEARELGFLADADHIVMNRDHLLAEAKGLALSLAPGYRPPEAGPVIWAGGLRVLAGLQLVIDQLVAAGRASEHDARIANHLAYILAGGDLSEPQWVEEQYILDLEREAFIALCHEPKSIERMWAMLKTGQPLRN
jgi:3-hydroxyacyl-CoA dehydrogenase